MKLTFLILSKDKFHKEDTVHHRASKGGIEVVEDPLAEAIIKIDETDLVEKERAGVEEEEAEAIMVPKVAGNSFNFKNLKTSVHYFI